jgi:DNA-binding IscR family transcriptional regulator
MSDGIVTSLEKAHIEELRERFNIPEEHARQIFALLTDKK